MSTRFVICERTCGKSTHRCGTSEGSRVAWKRALRVFAETKPSNPGLLWDGGIRIKILRTMILNLRLGFKGKTGQKFQCWAPIFNWNLPQSRTCDQIMGLHFFCLGNNSHDKCEIMLLKWIFNWLQCKGWQVASLCTSSSTLPWLSWGRNGNFCTFEYTLELTKETLWQAKFPSNMQLKAPRTC